MASIIEESNSIEFEINKERYKLKISNDSSKIQLSLQDFSSSTEYYLEKSLEDLKKINRYFSIFTDSGDLSINLIKQVKKDNITINKDSNSCNLQIKNLNIREIRIFKFNRKRISRMQRVSRISI